MANPFFGRGRRKRVATILTKHFGRTELQSLTISERKFPLRVQADLQRAVESLFQAANALLNKLLNEMDGLKEAADILFILTTNRPEALEAALASRPGRVDQAIEFPLPDEEGRAKLVRLYGKGTVFSDDLVRTIVSRTEKVSAAFIKELIRRSVQFQLEREGVTRLEAQDVDNALDEMLFSGGSLNVKLLGGNVDGRQSDGGGVAALFR